MSRSEHSFFDVGPSGVLLALDPAHIAAVERPLDITSDCAIGNGRINRVRPGRWHVSITWTEERPNDPPRPGRVLLAHEHARDEAAGAWVFAPIAIGVDGGTLGFWCRDAFDPGEAERLLDGGARVSQGGVVACTGADGDFWVLVSRSAKGDVLGVAVDFADMGDLPDIGGAPEPDALPWDIDGYL